MDNRDKKFDINDAKNIKFLCHRRFGVGADGIILLEKQKDYDFKMIFDIVRPCLTILYFVIYKHVYKKNSVCLW